jgi:putative hydrolase of the HAD superfamily
MITLVCFDLGGVLVHVATTWPEAMRAAGIEPTVPEQTALHAAPSFDPYQAGQIDTPTYLRSLAEFLQVTEAAAEQAHDHILLEPTLGTLDIVTELNAGPTKTACLSNTNELHWRELLGPRFPNIQALKIHLASQNLGLAKPDLRIFRRFEELTQTPADQILFFEDTEVNVFAAQAAGWNVVRIDPKGSQESQIRAGLDAHGIQPKNLAAL